MAEILRIDAEHQLDDLVASSLKYVLPSMNHSVRYRIRNRRVCLTGQVKSYYQKQIAQEALLQIEQVDEVLNLLHVAR